MKKRTILLFVAVLAFSTTAEARSYAPKLSSFFDFDHRQPKYSEFESWVGELGLAMAPKFLGPAATLGSMGFEVSMEVGLTTINNTRDYWKNAAENPASLLVTNQIRLSKGLPYSLQVAGLITHLYESGIWGIGAEIGAALVEGFRYVPDFSVKATVGTLLGAGDLSFLQAGMATVLSKRFSIAGLFTVAPFAGYNFIFIHAGTYLTGSVTQNSAQSNDKVQEFVIDSRNVYKHRAILGFDIVATYLTFGCEFGLGPGQTTYAFKVGTTF